MVLIYVTKTDFYISWEKRWSHIFKFTQYEDRIAIPIKFDNFSRFDYGNEICDEKCAARWEFLFCLLNLLLSISSFP